MNKEFKKLIDVFFNIGMLISLILGTLQLILNSGLEIILLFILISIIYLSNNIYLLIKNNVDKKRKRFIYNNGITNDIKYSNKTINNINKKNIYRTLITTFNNIKCIENKELQEKILAKTLRILNETNNNSINTTCSKLDVINKTIDEVLNINNMFEENNKIYIKK